MRHTHSSPIQNVTLCVQCCGSPDLARLLTNSTYVMTTEVLEILQLVQLPAKVGQAISNQN